MVEVNSTSTGVTPESVFKMLREARDLLPTDERAAKNTHSLLETLEVTVFHAEQLNLLADAEIKKIEAASFDDFTKVQLITNWIEAKKLASSMINRAMLETIQAAIVIQRNNGGNTLPLTQIMEKILNVKSRKIAIGKLKPPETAG